jgi:hypothetical protein
VETTYQPRAPHTPVRPVLAAPVTTPAAMRPAGDPSASRRLRSAAAVALAGSGLLVGPALWLGLAAWASSAGLAPLAVSLGALGLLAALVPVLLALRGPRAPDDGPGADAAGPVLPTP